VVVQPTIAEATVSAGGRARLAFSLLNKATWAYDVRASVADLDLAPNGFPSAAPQARERGASRWLAITPSAFPLAAGGGMKVQADVQVPRGCVGTYSAIITWELVARSRPNGSGSRMRLSAVALLSVRGPGKAAPLLTASSIDLRPARPGPWQVRVPVANAGNLSARIAGTVTFRQVGGTQVASTPITSGRGYVLPGGERDLTGSLVAPLRDGAYIAVAAVAVESSSAQIRRVGYFLVRNGAVEAKPPTESALRDLLAMVPPVTCDQTIIAQSVAPGGQRTISIKVTNNTAVTLELRAKVAGAPGGALNAAALPASLPADRARPELFGVSGEAQRVDPGRTVPVKAVFTVPPGGRGEYYAYLLVTATRPGRAGSALPPVGALLAVGAKGTTAQQAEIRGVSIRRVGGGRASYTVRVANTGSALLTGSGVVSVLGDGGKEVGRQTFSLPDFLLPSTSATVEVRPDYPVPSGKHQVRVALQFGQSGVATKDWTVGLR
jgi:hypothetical protein